ncbi:Epidermal growth factor-like protein 6 [Mactra antiquata]
MSEVDLQIVLLVAAIAIVDVSHGATQCGDIECVVEASGCKDKGNGTYICECFVGLLGDACEIDRDECTEHKHSPCGHRGYCINSFGSYTCNCLRGWAGLTCRSHTSSQPGDFDCFPGYTGKFCNYDIDECSSGATLCPGQNEHCVNTEGSYNCSCNNGWEGPDCMNDIDECLNDPCGENEICQNTPGSYSCICMKGWYGEHCDQNIDECVTEPCGQFGVCVDTNGSFTCECMSGYIGDLCEINNEDITMSSTNYVIIGILSSLLLIFLLLIIVLCTCMRYKIKHLTQRMDEINHRKSLHNKTSKIQPVDPMFTIKRKIEDEYDNRWSTMSSAPYRGRESADINDYNDSLMTTSEAQTRGVHPYNGNIGYTRSPSKDRTYVNMKRSNQVTNLASVPVQYEVDTMYLT